jgi:hypothetical protein
MFADENNPKAGLIMLMGESFQRLPFQPDDPDWLCIDCEAAAGEIHELGCDTEDCPRCGAQLISCGCLAIPD